MALKLHLIQPRTGKKRWFLSFSWMTFLLGGLLFPFVTRRLWTWLVIFLVYYLVLLVAVVHTSPDKGPANVIRLLGVGMALWAGFVANGQATRKMLAHGWVVSPDTTDEAWSYFQKRWKLPFEARSPKQATVTRQVEMARGKQPVALPAPSQDPLGDALGKFVSEHIGEMSPYAWRVGDAAWSTLGTGFDYKRFANDLPRQNIELKAHLSKYWQSADLDEQIRLANWIVSDWGGIHRNSAMTILGYVNQANSERPATPFYGIASYSKILAMSAPYTHAVFDARVAASVDAIQVLLRHDGKLSSLHLRAFPIPPGRNDTVNEFARAAFPTGLGKLGFEHVAKDDVYNSYLKLLRSVAPAVSRSILEVEMFLFAQADDLCRKALPHIR